MKSAFLHVGLPKTGSTSIQDFLFEERKALETAGFLFPSPASDVRAERKEMGEGWGRHASLLAALQERWDDLAPGEWEKWLAEFARFRADPELHTLLLSHETIGNRAAMMNLSSLAQLLHGTQLRILIVVREAEAWLTSLFEQRVTGRSRKSDAPSRFREVADYVDRGFQGRIEALQRALPSAEIVVAAFETLIAGEGLVANSCDLMGIPASVRDRAVGARRANTSFSQDRVELLRRLNEAQVGTADFQAARHALGRHQRRSAAAMERAAERQEARGVAVERPKKVPRRRIFDAETAQAIAARYDADREWIGAHFGVALAAQPLKPLEPLETGTDHLLALLAAASEPIAADQRQRLEEALSRPVAPARPMRPRGRRSARRP